MRARAAGGLEVEVIERHRGPLGAVGRSRVGQLRERGLAQSASGEDEEETIVVYARRGPD